MGIHSGAVLTARLPIHIIAQNTGICKQRTQKRGRFFNLPRWFFRKHDHSFSFSDGEQPKNAM